MSCSVSRVHESFCWSVFNRQSLGSCMLGKLFCVLALFVFNVARQLRRYPLKRQNSPIFSLLLSLKKQTYILGHSMALHWPERQRVLSYSGLSHSQCARPLLGLALALSLSPPPVSLFILYSSNRIFFRILPPYLKTNSCKRTFQFLLMKSAKKRSLLSSCVFWLSMPCYI